MILWFGKFKGTDLEEVPSSYLKWIAENVDENSLRKKKLVERADTEYQWREKYNEHFDD